jgi:hypothetical protein
LERPVVGHVAACATPGDKKANTTKTSQIKREREKERNFYLLLFFSSFLVVVAFLVLDSNKKYKKKTKIKKFEF